MERERGDCLSLGRNPHGLPRLKWKLGGGCTVSAAQRSAFSSPSPSSLPGDVSNSQIVNVLS